MTSITREAPAQTAPEFASRAENLQNLLDAVDDAANTSFTLWVSYLFALFYLLIAVGSVTHRDLLLESPIKLPFLSVELPLVGFFWLGPVLFVIVHAYVLLHLVLLASKVGAFREQLQKQSPTLRPRHLSVASCRTTSLCNSLPGQATCKRGSSAGCFC